MSDQKLLVANDRHEAAKIWRVAILEGEARAGVNLSPKLEQFLVETLLHNTLSLDINYPVALDALSAIKKNDSFAYVTLGGKCLIIAGLFPGLAGRRNVRIGYYIEFGKGAYQSHANYWKMKGFTSMAQLSQDAAEHFEVLVATLRGIGIKEVITEDVAAVSLPRSAWN